MREEAANDVVGWLVVEMDGIEDECLPRVIRKRIIRGGRKGIKVFLGRDVSSMKFLEDTDLMLLNIPHEDIDELCCEIRRPPGTHKFNIRRQTNRNWGPTTSLRVNGEFAQRAITLQNGDYIELGSSVVMYWFYSRRDCQRSFREAEKSIVVPSYPQLIVVFRPKPWEHRSGRFVGWQGLKRVFFDEVALQSTDDSFLDFFDSFEFLPLNGGTDVVNSSRKRSRSDDDHVTITLDI